jgi:hypothetical protein
MLSIARDGVLADSLLPVHDPFHTSLNAEPLRVRRLHFQRSLQQDELLCPPPLPALQDNKVKARGQALAFIRGTVKPR